MVFKVIFNSLLILFFEIINLFLVLSLSNWSKDQMNNIDCRSESKNHQKYLSKQVLNLLVFHKACEDDHEIGRNSKQSLDAYFQ